MRHFGKNTSLIPYKIGSLFQLVFQTQLSHLSHIPLTPCFNFSCVFFFFFSKSPLFLFWKIKNSYYKKPLLFHILNSPISPIFHSHHIFTSYFSLYQDFFVSTLKKERLIYFFLSFLFSVKFPVSLL